ncbi:growth factor receptor-bound protein 2-like [Gigantopelta aegis]|uniref:growth factor receptor-bound protein 2-like n=1 Tax=Gigantopelta aegis TaxID=1735272 RepID=UPI001B88AC47|nr:growth factor receptor-bound protein 2-like [Gigantopelta aegis]
MEAVASYDFNASEPDELSFKKGDVLKILNMDDTNWYKSEVNGKTGFVPSPYITLVPSPWYVGKIERHEAEQKLLETTAGGKYKHPDGAFLVRNSQTDPDGMSLSVKQGTGVQHFKILRDAQGKYFLWTVKFDSIHKLIEYHRHNNVTRDQSTIIFLRDMGTGAPAQGGDSLFKARCLFDFNPSDPEELAFRKGDILNILDQNDVNWWKAELNGRTGLVPKTYIEEM